MAPLCWCNEYACWFTHHWTPSRSKQGLGETEREGQAQGQHLHWIAVENLAESLPSEGTTCHRWPHSWAVKRTWSSPLPGQGPLHPRWVGNSRALTVPRWLVTLLFNFRAAQQQSWRGNACTWSSHRLPPLTPASPPQCQLHNRPQCSSCSTEYSASSCPYSPLPVRTGTQLGFHLTGVDPSWLLLFGLHWRQQSRKYFTFALYSKPQRGMTQEHFLLRAKAANKIKIKAIKPFLKQGTLRKCSKFYAESPYLLLALSEK